MSGPQREAMAKAIELSKLGGIVNKTGGCFGCVIVDESGNIIAAENNKVIANNDPTAHGEVEAIRVACKKLGSPHLSGCTLYTSAEPCTMCYSACMWAHVKAVYFGATYEDVKEYGDFDDSDFSEQLKLPYEKRDIPCEEFMRSEALEVWKEFKELPDRAHY